MIHRLFNKLLTKDRFDAEKQTIHRIARINGYAHNIIDQLFKKHQRRKSLRCALSFDTNAFDRLNNIFAHVNARFAAKNGTK